jgi:tRNA threonylcarbamoyladenosine biosynthesis protein TsaB
VAIRELLAETEIDIKSLDAIGISHGPGSYTGLRIGMSAAKGLCYALDIPLITISTLEIMTMAAVELIPHESRKQVELLSPMIDARRKEVYMGIFNPSLEVILDPIAVNLDEYKLDDWLDKYKIMFFGNGSKKFMEQTHHANAFFKEFDFTGAVFMIKKSLQKYDNGLFADLALSEPLYIKEFHDTKSK